MTLHRRVPVVGARITCDHPDCTATHDRTPFTGSATQQLIRAARRDGWARIWGLDYCPHHHTQQQEGQR